MKKVKYIIMLFATAAIVACGGEAPTNNEESSMEEASHESHEGHDHAAMEEKTKTMEAQRAPEGARVFFVSLEDGQSIESPVKIEMGAEGINVHPAGEIIEGTGHHHIIVDGEPVPFGEMVPADEQHIHFGGGQTETELELTPGSHTLTLQFADGLHRSYGAEMAATINVEVAESAQ